MLPPEIERSTREEREAYIKDALRCKSDCENCGMCRIFRGKTPEVVYAGFQKCMQQIVSREIEHWESVESNVATVAGILRMTLKKFAAENGLELR